jgi:hypothetical protein
MSQRVIMVDSVVLDSNGFGQVTLTPQGGLFTVTVTSVSVSVNTPPNQPMAKIYLAVVGDSGFIEGTNSGDSDTSDTVYQVQQGEPLTCVWTDGDPGARATFRAAGTIG